MPLVTVAVNSREHRALAKPLVSFSVIVSVARFGETAFHGRSCKNRRDLHCSRFHRAGLRIFIGTQPIHCGARQAGQGTTAELSDDQRGELRALWLDYILGI